MPHIKKQVHAGEKKSDVRSFPSFAIFKDKFFNLVSVSLSVKWG